MATLGSLRRLQVAKFDGEPGTWQALSQLTALRQLELERCSMLLMWAVLLRPSCCIVCCTVACCAWTVLWAVSGQGSNDAGCLAAVIALPFTASVVCVAGQLASLALLCEASRQVQAIFWLMAPDLTDMH